jgi:hypothetical protein
MLSIPPLIRVFMLRPLQRELYDVAFVVSAYTDLVFTIGTAGGVFFGRLVAPTNLKPRSASKNADDSAFQMLRLDAKGCLARVFDRTLRPPVTEPLISLGAAHSIHKTPRRI